MAPELHAPSPPSVAHVLLFSYIVHIHSVYGFVEKEQDVQKRKKIPLKVVVKSSHGTERNSDKHVLT